MKFLRNELLSFYDDLESTLFANKKRRGSDVSAITGMIGEEIMIAIFMHYLAASSKLKPRRLEDSCKQKGARRKELDCWIVLGKEALFQVEVKNWSAHSLGGRHLAANAPIEIVHAEADRRWKQYFGKGKSLPAAAAKVLEKMPRPDGFKDLKLERLLCFWFAISAPKHTPISIVNVSRKRLHVFSASLYLRSLKENVLTLEVPRVEDRLRQLRALVYQEPRSDLCEFQ